MAQSQRRQIICFSKLYKLFSALHLRCGVFYVYDGDGNIVRSIDMTAEKEYNYIYNDYAYYFLNNLQGDVIAITNKKGKVVSSSSYDAWGVCTIVSDNTGVIARVKINASFHIQKEHGG